MTYFQAPTTAPSSAAPVALDVLPHLRVRITSASASLHETLDQLMGAMETQVRELQALRQQVQALEAARTQPALPAQPTMAMPAPVATRSLPSMAPPVPQLSILPAPTQQAPVPAAPVVPNRLPSGPMMTQILWPSKVTSGTEPMEGHLSTPTQALSPSVMQQQMAPPIVKMNVPPPVQPQIPAQPQLVQQQHPVQQQPVHHHAAHTPAPDLTPSLEQATLEELNAALAYAFAHVAGTKPMNKSGVTQMIPPPLPTSALRYGQLPELAGMH